MRVALFTPYLPLPADSGGRIRITRLAAALRGRAEVRLFASAGPRQLAEVSLAELEASYDGVSCGRRPFALPCGRRPRRVRLADARALRRAFRSEHRKRSFDVAVVAHSHAAAIALRSGLPVVVDEHNVESRYSLETARARGEAPRELARYEAWERAVWRSAARIVTVSRDDAREIRARVPEARLEIVENGTDVGKITFVPPSRRTGHDLLFVGLLSHGPNVTAALRLAQVILPRVRERVPEARLVLCGRDPAPEVRALAGPLVEVTGRVPEVGPQLERARAIAIPLVHGAGTSLKVAEALASGAPLVATSVGVRGYGDEIRELCDVADDDGAFASALVRVLEGAGGDARAESARRFAEGYDWAALGRRFADIVGEAAG